MADTMTKTNPYDRLSDLLSEMQIELVRREWSEDVDDRIKRASDFRVKLFDAIEAYTDFYVRMSLDELFAELNR